MISGKPSCRLGKLGNGNGEVKGKPGGLSGRAEGPSAGSGASPALGSRQRDGERLLASNPTHQTSRRSLEALRRPLPCGTQS